MNKSYKQAVLAFAGQTFGTEAEYLWAKFPDYAVLRHRTNKKWYAVLMDVPRAKLGLPGGGTVEIIDVKCDPVFTGTLRQNKGFLPAYHMNKEKWITVLLDGTVAIDEILQLVRESHTLTGGTK